MKYQYKLNQSTIEYLDNLVSKHKDLFDEELFKEWYYSNNIGFKSQPDSYVKSCFEKLLLDERFKPIKHVLNCEPLFSRMRLYEIEIIPEDTLYISIMETHFIDEKQLTIEELKELNHKAIDYIKGKYDCPNTKHFIDVFKKSKKKFNFEGIENEYRNIR